MKSFSLKNMKIGRIHHGTSPQESCQDCETPHDIVSSGKGETAGSGSDSQGNTFNSVGGIVDAASLAKSISSTYGTGTISTSLGGSGAVVSGGGYTIGGGGSYHAVGSSSLGAFSVGPPIPSVSDMKLNRRTLTDTELAKIIEQVVVTVKPGEKIIVMADSSNTADQQQMLTDAFRAYGVDAVVVAGADIEPYESQPVTSEFDRLDVLSRLAVIWQENPTFRLGQLIGLALGMAEQDKLWNIPDEDLGIVVEKAYRRAGGRMLKKGKP